MKKIMAVMLLALFLFAPIVAATTGGGLTGDQETAKNELVAAVMGIYDMFKYVATAVAILLVAFAGMKFMGAGNDPMARNEAKTWLTYIAVGIILIWLAPVIVEALV